MKVLVVGSGGREHALSWRISQSAGLTGLWHASGNAGTARLGTNLDIAPDDIDGLVAATRSLSIDLVVVGPEQPLATGLVDRLQSLGIPAFGPTQAAAQLEASKSFARRVMEQASVPAPDFRVFHDERSALDFVDRHSGSLVIKADGLAAGKGVLICRTRDDAVAAVKSCMSERAFGAAGETIVVEELLTGLEVSVFAFTDGEHLSSLVAACDYKRIGDNDQGPNTGGMGGYAPPAFWDDHLAGIIRDTILQPVVESMNQRGLPYRGMLYAGLMLTPSGPKVLEFNCRFGDPEAQLVLPLMEGDPLAVLTACHQGNLPTAPVSWNRLPHVGVVLTSGGYPDRYQTGFEIFGLDQEQSDTLVFHAGTWQATSEGRYCVVTAGGRVLTVVGRGDSIESARQRAYGRAGTIHFNNIYYRRDIALFPAQAPETEWTPGSAAPTG